MYNLNDREYVRIRAHDGAMIYITNSFNCFLNM